MMHKWNDFILHVNIDGKILTKGKESSITHLSEVWKCKEVSLLASNTIHIMVNIEKHLW